MRRSTVDIFFFFFNDTATTEIYTLSLHDALPIWCRTGPHQHLRRVRQKGHQQGPGSFRGCTLDRKSTRLNSSHANISYAVFCLKKKKKKERKPCSAQPAAHAPPALDREQRTLSAR